MPLAEPVTSAGTTPPALLEARDVEFGYSTAAPLLSGWSARFGGSTMTSLTGPSGRGKSTLLYILGLMLRPTAGHILLNGEEVSDGGDRRRSITRAHRYGFVFQDAALDPTRTVLDNVVETSLYRKASRRDDEARAEELLRQFGVEAPLLRRPGQVSGGQAQRIALCRALLNRPDVILADEPTGNLDPITADLVVNALRQRADEGAAVIIVTHSPAVAAQCDMEIKL